TRTATRTGTVTPTLSQTPCVPVPACGSSSAYGESVDVSVLGGAVQVTSGPLPAVSGTAPPAYNLSDSLASAFVTSSATGQILQTGVLDVHASSSIPTSGFVDADSTVNNLNLDLLLLLGLNATSAQSTASVTGCAGAFVV